MLACSCFAPLQAEEAIHSISVSLARDYGIVMGETLAAEIRAAVEPGYELETANLPQAGSAVSDFMELREAHWTKQPDGNLTVYRLNHVYQVFKGVREAETLTTPALPLRFRRGGQTVETQVPAWNFTLTPLIPAKTPDEDVILRGDLPPPVYSTTDHWRWMAALLAGLFGLGLYAARRLGLFLFRRDASPFVRAAAGLKSLGGQPPGPDIYRQGAKLVHAALNETAGRSLFSSQLERFLADFPQYADASSELERFFGLSDRLFFESLEECPSDYPLSRLEALCRRLAATGSTRR